MKEGRLFFAVATALTTACLLASEPRAQTEEKEPPAQSAPKRIGPCTPDIQNFCKGVKRGGGAIMRCLKEHEDELSGPCKDFREKARLLSSEPRTQTEEKAPPTQSAPKRIGPCAPDIQNFCKDVKRGGGAIMRCLREHEDELSGSCKDFREKARLRREASKRGAVEPQEKTESGAVEPQEKTESGAVEPREKTESGVAAEPGMGARQEAVDWTQACEAEINNFCMDVLRGRNHRLKCLEEHAAELSSSCQATMPKKGKAGQAPAAENPQEGAR